MFKAVIILVVVSCFAMRVSANSNSSKPVAPILPNNLLIEATFTLISKKVGVASGHIYTLVDMVNSLERFRVTTPIDTTIYSDTIVDFKDETIYSISASDASAPTCTVYRNLKLYPKNPNFINEHCTFVWAAEANGLPATQWFCPIAPPGSLLVPKVNIMTTPYAIVTETITTIGVQEFISIDTYESLPSIPSSAFKPPSFCNVSNAVTNVSLDEIHVRLLAMFELKTATSEESD